MGRLQVKTYFDQLSSGWSDRYKHRADYLERSDIFSSLIAEAMSAREISSVLEIGCGAKSMFDASKYPGIDYFATDISYEMLIRNSAPAQFFQADILQHPIMAKFDLVVLSSVVEWLEDPDIVPSIMANLVKHDGVLLVSYPNGYSILRYLEKNIISRFKSILSRRHYTDMQAKAQYRRLEDGFLLEGFHLQAVRYFGKKLVLNGRYSSSLRLDSYIKVKS